MTREEVLSARRLVNYVSRTDSVTKKRFVELVWNLTTDLQTVRWAAEGKTEMYPER